MINFTNVKFIKSSPNYLDAPLELSKEVLIVGKSNVGKSSLINALTKKKNLAHTSSKPGHTKLLNYYNIDNSFYLVDAPGYGYTATGGKHLDNFGKMMEEYFDNPHLKGVIHLIDSRHEPSKDDKDFYAFLKESNIPFIIIFTKVDKLNQSELSKLNKRRKELFSEDLTLLSDITKEKYLDNIRMEISRLALN